MSAIEIPGLGIEDRSPGTYRVRTQQLAWPMNGDKASETQLTLLDTRTHRPFVPCPAGWKP